MVPLLQVTAASLSWVVVIDGTMIVVVVDTKVCAV